MYDLGPTLFNVAGKKAFRTDKTLTNKNNNKIYMSFYGLEYEPQKKCVIYLHTHHGSRLEGTPLVDAILKAGLNVCLFDFSGYGNSEGEIVTLGIE